MKRPADLYVSSARIYRGLPEVEYPLHDRDVLVTACGRICMHRKKINISTALAGPNLRKDVLDEIVALVAQVAKG